MQPATLSPSRELARLAVLRRRRAAVHRATSAAAQHALNGSLFLSATYSRT
ncbi:hypothetical protein [Geodermatophilus sp. URMC 64]